MRFEKSGSTLQKVTRRFLVAGRVQGVYFRQSTRVEAERLAIRGVARNLPDGAVEVIAHGTREAVNSLRAWLSHGPAMARVSEVREVELGPEHDFSGQVSGAADRAGNSRSFAIE